MSSNARDSKEPTPVLVRAVRSTVGRESTTFGFSILVTVTFGLLQSIHQAPTVQQVFAFAVGAVLSFTLLEGVMSAGFRKPMPQHHTETLALGTALNLFSVLSGLAVAWVLAATISGLWMWGLAPLAGGVVYLLVESAETAVAERLLLHAGDREADEVES